MRIATYEHDGATRAGIVEGEAVRPLDEGTDPISLLTMSPEQRAALALGEAANALDAVRLRPPIRPPAVRDFVAFEQHVEGMVIVEGARREGAGGLVPGAGLLLLQPQRAVRHRRRHRGAAALPAASTTSSRSQRSSASRGAT